MIGINTVPTAVLSLANLLSGVFELTDSVTISIRCSTCVTAIVTFYCMLRFGGSVDVEHRRSVIFEPWHLYCNYIGTRIESIDYVNILFLLTFFTYNIPR